MRFKEISISGWAFLPLVVLFEQVRFKEGSTLLRKLLSTIVLFEQVRFKARNKKAIELAQYVLFEQVRFKVGKLTELYIKRQLFYLNK